MLHNYVKTFYICNMLKQMTKSIYVDAMLNQITFCLAELES